MSEPEPIKVLIINQDGQYIAGSAHHWEFTDDRTRARVFDYTEDRVAEQIQLVRKTHGCIWIAVRLDPREIFEFCDRCGSRMIARNIFFDGEKYVCRNCRQ